MNKQSKLLEMMFADIKRWEELLVHADEKDINKTILRKMAEPQERLKLYYMIVNGDYEIAPPKVALIPKDNGEFRTVYANTNEDRIICTLINDCISELFKHKIHKNCVSYQKKLGYQLVVEEVSNEIHKLNKIITDKNVMIGAVSDFSKYFDTVSIDAIDNMFDSWETDLGFEYGTEPVINALRKYYHSTLYIDEKGNLQNKYLSLRQGCAVAAVLSNMIMYELDEYMSNKYKIYYRYSDDCIVIDPRYTLEEITNDINRIASKYGVKLNDKKVRPVYANEYFKFLGFNIKGNVVTLSKNRTKDFCKEIYRITIGNPNVSYSQAIKNVKYFLYGNGDGYSWATACFHAMRNNYKDIEIMNNYIMDCIRLCKVRDEKYKQRELQGLKPRKFKYGKDDIGGIGVVTNLSDRTMIRGKGKCIKTGKDRTEKEIKRYKTMGCLLKNYKISKSVYESVVRGM